MKQHWKYVMPIVHSQNCQHQISDRAKVRPGNFVPGRKSPLARFTCIYFLGGIVTLGLYCVFGNIDIAIFLAANWLAVGLALALIAYGVLRKDTSDLAAVMYLLGFAWLVILLVLGIVLIWNDGIGVQELSWLLA